MINTKYIDVADFITGYDYYMITSPVIFPTVTIILDDNIGDIIPENFKDDPDTLLYITYSPQYNGLENCLTLDTFDGRIYIDISENDKKALTDRINTQLAHFDNTDLDTLICQAQKEYF